MEQVQKIDSKLNSIELLRIMGVILICVFHSLYALDKNFEIYKYGRMSAIFVECFFIIAGFFLPNIIITQIAFKDFAIKKILRLFPVVFTVTIFINIFQTHVPLYNILPDFFLLSSVGFAQQQALCGYAWFLYVLFWVSCFYYCLINFIQDKRKLNFTIILIIYFSLIILTSNSLLTFSHKVNIYHLYNIGILRGLVGIGLGIIIRLNFYKPNYTLSTKQKIFFTFLELFFFFYLIINLTCVEKTKAINYIVSYLIIFSVIIISWVNGLGYFSQILNKINFYSISKYSFSIYILQTIPRMFLFKIQGLDGGLYIFIYLLVSVILGIIAYHAIEVPCRKLYKNSTVGGGPLL